MDNLVSHLQPLLDSFAFSGKWFAICAMLFIPLACVFPGKNSQPLLRRDMIADSLYWLCGPIVYGPIFIKLLFFLLSLVYTAGTIDLLLTHGLSPMANLPLLVQAFLALLATDFLQYWAHRLFHGAKLWKFHAVNHSPPAA